MEAGRDPGTFFLPRRRAVARGNLSHLWSRKHRYFRGSRCGGAVPVAPSVAVQTPRVGRTAPLRPYEARERRGPDPARTPLPAPLGGLSPGGLNPGGFPTLLLQQLSPARRARPKTGEQPASEGGGSGCRAHTAPGRGIHGVGRKQTGGPGCGVGPLPGLPPARALVIPPAVTQLPSDSGDVNEPR